MYRLFIVIGLLTLGGTAWAADFSDRVTDIAKNGRWIVMEFAARDQLIYRLATTSTNFTSTNIAFDFAPSAKCEPAPAVMIQKRDSYLPILDKGILILSFKISGQPESRDLLTTEMAPENAVAFFSFRKLTVGALLQAKDKGSLSIWIPASADGVVRRSDNINFSMTGFSAAYKRARTRCEDGR